MKRWRQWSNLAIARWFKSLGPCASCGKAATGELMSYRNERLAATCKRCGEAAAKEGNRLAQKS